MRGVLGAPRGAGLCSLRVLSACAGSMLRTFTHDCGIDDRCAGEWVVSIADVEDDFAGGWNQCAPEPSPTDLSVSLAQRRLAGFGHLILSHQRHSI